MGEVASTGIEHEVAKYFEDDGWVTVTRYFNGLYRIWSDFNDLWFVRDKDNWTFLPDGPQTPEKNRKATVEEDWVNVPKEIREMLDDVITSA